MIHFILQLKINYIPESLAVVLMGAAIGMGTKLLSSKNFGDWKVRTKTIVITIVRFDFFDC